MATLRAALLAASAAGAAAVLGIDVSQPVSADAAACFAKAGASFAIVRAWESLGRFDSSAPGSVASFWGAGFAHVDVYLFPCALRSAGPQLAQLRGNLTEHGVKFGQLWLDIETDPSPGCAWSATDKAANCAYLAQLVAAAKAEGFNTGIYVSAYMWESIMGSSCTAGAGAPLWYPRYDGEPSFSDFSPFGPFTRPAMKQWNDNFVTNCGVGADSNYYPA